MSFWDHVPIVGTVKRAMTHWEGGEVHDYVSCAVRDASCEGYEGRRLEEERCRKCVTDMQNEYIRDLPSPPIVKDVLEALGAGLAGTIGWALIRSGAKAGAKAWVGILGRVLVGAGIVLAVDALADVALYFWRKFKVGEASRAAIARWCKCPPQT